MSALTVVVADSSRARLFGIDKPRLPMVEQDSLLNPDARMSEHELRDDEPGATFESHGHGQRSTDSASMKDNHTAQFAHMVAGHLMLMRSKGKLSKLALVAPPKFLGLLRDEFDAPSRQCVIAEVDKNLVREKPEAIRKHLPEYF